MKALSISLLLAIGGASAAYHWFPATDSLARYPSTLSRSEAIARARVLSASYGWNVDHWVAWVEADRNQRIYEFLRTAPDHPLAHAAQPYSMTVVFTRGPLRVRVEFGGNGRPIEFAFRDGRRPDFAGQPLTKEQEQRILADFAGPSESANYQQTSSVNRGTQGHSTTWEWREEDEPDLIQQLQAVSSPDGIRQVTMRSELSESFLQRYVAGIGSIGFRFVAIPILIVVGISLTNLLFFTALARGHIRTKPALAMFAALTAISLLGFAGGTSWDRLQIAANAGDEPPPQALLQSAGMAMAGSALFAAMWAVGRALMRTAGLERWQTVDALLEGRCWRRQVGQSIACGLLLGAALSAIPVALGAAGLFARNDLYLASPSSLAAIQPVVLPLAQLIPWVLGGFFFLLVPLASSIYGRRFIPAWARWLLVAVLGVLINSLSRDLSTDPVSYYVVGGALVAGFFGVYWCFDLLAAMMAEIGYSAALLSIFFLRQPSPGLETHGLWTAAVYGALAITGIVALLFAPDLEPAPEERVVEIVAERQILENEFAMAREAQQRLLPPIPARLDGFSLAASCHPARDVGGDLYDFFRYQDGTYGMCVADVSGKGVPAALYMTMTKGILIAASRDPADLRALASALNTQLYAAGRKKTFVTMALGRLHVDSRTLEYVRAGHNSILWRRTSLGGVCEYRKPRGVGLGLTPGRLFDRSIEVETLSLDRGDVVVFYSDGITEAMNAARELFGEQRLEDVVMAHPDLDAAELERAILGEVREFMGGEPPHDDMTLLVIRA